ncbi:MAG: hypothetical protein M1830_000029 [Pleopsidium flavum]|nr:MAG: hypothetical protein M1830_000029 [Pleopsidium flavum]
MGPSSATSSASSGRNPSSTAGAIAGGVIGGLAVIALATWLVWRFCIKPRRQEYDENEWPEGGVGGEKGDDGFTMQRNARASTHTVGSIASTVLTRASNVIQIAYIPGVTNRSPPSTPGHLIPPVPPLPFESSPSMNASTPHFGQDQHFFMPGDLRDSTYSGVTDSDGRSSFARQSITPSLARSSVATTIYRNNAIINPAPAQTVLRGKAAVVSVKSSGTTTPIESPDGLTPPVPTIDFERHGFANSNSPIIARAGTARPVNVRKTSSQGKLSTRNGSSGASAITLVNPKSERHVTPEESEKSRALRYNGDASTFDNASSEDEEPKSSVGKSLMGHDRVASQAITVIEDSPAVRQSAFTGPSGPSLPDRNPARSSAAASGHKQKGSLSQVIEEATRKASREPRHGGLGSVGSVGSFKRDPSPFSDENEVRGAR